MADREPTDWITVNGKHIPIYEGESKQDAVNRSIAKKNESEKERQIAENKKQADKLNASEKKLPRNLYLPNIKAEDANLTSKIRDFKTGRTFKFKSDIKKVNVFAGKGCSRVFRNAEYYAEKYGGKPEDWQHCAGWAKITNGKYTLYKEIHWVQNANNGKVYEAFIKYHDN